MQFLWSHIRNFLYIRIQLTSQHRKGDFKDSNIDILFWSKKKEFAHIGCCISFFSGTLGLARRIAESEYYRSLVEFPHRLQYFLGECTADSGGTDENGGFRCVYDFRETVDGLAVSGEVNLVLGYSTAGTIFYYESSRVYHPYLALGLGFADSFLFHGHHAEPRNAEGCLYKKNKEALKFHKNKREQCSIGKK